MSILAAVACLILIGGWLVRPRDIPQRPEAAPTESEMEQLARRAERRTLDNTAKYFAGVARDVDATIARVQGAAVSGVAWDDSHVVSPARPGGWGPEPVLLTAAVQTESRPAIAGPRLPLSLLAISRGPRLPPARRAASLPPAGDWIVAVWRTDAAPAFAVGHFRQSSAITCGVTQVQELDSSLSFTSTMAGAGVFDLDGGLLAVVLPCDERLVAVATAGIQEILRRAATSDQHMEGRYGLTVGALSEEETRYFKTARGLLVRDVWIGYAGDAAGVRPGDLITAVNGEAVSRPEDLSALAASSETEIALTMNRGRKSLAVTLASRVTPSRVQPAGAGLRMEEPSPRTYRIGSVRPGSRAALAGIQGGDGLVRIDQAEPGSLDQIERILDGDQRRPVWLELVRRGRQFGVLLR